MDVIRGLSLNTIQFFYMLLPEPSARFSHQEVDTVSHFSSCNICSDRAVQIVPRQFPGDQLPMRSLRTATGDLVCTL